MPGPGRLRLDGAKELRASLKRAGRDVADLKDANKAAADVVADQARKTAPVGPAPGHISETVRASGTQAAAIVRAGTARLPYGKPLHWGHKTAGVTPTKVPAQPWIYQAAVDTSAKWLPEYLQHIDRIVRSVEGTSTP